MTSKICHDVAKYGKYVMMSKSMSWYKKYGNDLITRKRTSCRHKIWKVHIDVQTYVMTSKSTPWRQKVWKIHHKFKEEYHYVKTWCTFHTDIMKSKGTLCRQISMPWRHKVWKIHHDFKRYFMILKSRSWRQNVRHEIKSMESTSRWKISQSEKHAITLKYTSLRQK